MYDEAKRFMEAATMAYHRERGVDTRIVRIFNTYGPRLAVDDGRVVVAFIMQALRNQPLTVQGDGSQTRSLCFVDDEIKGFLALMDADYHLPVNIGNPDEVSMLQLAREIRDLCGSKSEIIQTPLPPVGPRQRLPRYFARPQASSLAASHPPPGRPQTHRRLLSHQTQSLIRRFTIDGGRPIPARRQK